LGWTQLEISLGSIFRVKDFELIVPREISTEQGEEVPIDWPSQGAINISGITAQYKYVFRRIYNPSPKFVLIINEPRKF
jgi:hypothetical protein